MDSAFDVTIVGAGIVGLATAMKLVKLHPDLKVAVVEKEGAPARHQTGHNSGVIHSGIYYRPGSLKARLCVSGSLQLTEFCRENGVPFELCGKVVVATRPDEIPRLHELHRRGTANGVQGLRLLEPSEVREIEPHVRCLKGLHVPTTGIVSFGAVTEAYARIFQAQGGGLLLNRRVLTIMNRSGNIQLETDREVLSTRALINCGGLYADHVARMAGLQPPCRIVPFRGEYYEIRPERGFLVKTLIYPVPDPRFPFLGVHFTRMIDGKVEAGPNALLAWAREGYTRGTVSLPELMETLAFGGFRRMAGRYWRAGLKEMLRSISKSRFAAALQELVPEIHKEDLRPGGAGVRAQAVGRDGTLQDDFLILRKGRTVHVLNAPSPAATSSLAIAEYILGAASPLVP
jgi:L-2-hydroxyglutarate oxidase LhgO